MYCNNPDLNNSTEAYNITNYCKRSKPFRYCDICNWNGYPYGKIVVRNYRIRFEDEDGFIYEFNIFNYDPDRNKRISHKYKFNQELIDSQVNAILNQQGSMEQE
jgi:hypothetical protein